MHKTSEEWNTLFSKCILNDNLTDETIGSRYSIRFDIHAMAYVAHVVERTILNK